MQPHHQIPLTVDSGLAAVRLEAISVGIYHERGEVIRIVVGADSRRAVVLATGLQCARVKQIDTLASRCRKAEVQS
jgi:hypothetical protein